MAKLWMHIGSHKTGTTSTQKTLSGSRDALREVGLIYPWNRLDSPTDPGTVPGGYAQHYLVREAKTAKLDEQLDAMHEGFEGEEWLVSSELFSTLKAPMLAHLLEALSKRFSDIHAIMYVREPGKLAISRTATHIVMGNTTYEQACDKPKIYKYRRHLENWLQQLGKERMTVRVYDRPLLRNRDVVDDLLDVVGRDAQTIGLERATTGITPSHNAVLAMSERNARGDGQVRGGGLRSIPGPPFTLPKPIIDLIRQESADDVAWMKQEFGIEFAEPVDTELAR